MKGNQGLDTLAALCGGASIPDEGPKQHPAPSSVPAPAPGPTAVPTPWSISRGLPVQASTAGFLAPGPRASAPTDALAAMIQQIQGAASLMPAAAAAVAAQPDPVQQLAYFHLVQAQAAAAATQLSQAQAPQQQGIAAAPAASFADPKAVAIAVAAQQQTQQQDAPSMRCTTQQQQQILPAAAPVTTSQTVSSNGGTNSMQPPAPQVPTRASNSASSSVSSSNASSLPNTVPIAAAPPKIKAAPPAPIAKRPSFESEASSSIAAPSSDKRQLKRAANRRSAQLSRKRKKQFIEELKEENDELRRKEQILRSLPDLVVVFDSAGKLWFVSHSVKRFLGFSPHDLEGSSFWDRLCDESVRLLKAAFMDALAARFKDSATVPLGSGVWELRLVDRDGSHKLITLNGVVHFSGETPECVCSIRPREAHQNHLQPLAGGEPVEKKARVEFSSEGGGTADVRHFQPNLVRDAIKPQQSVISNGSSSADDVSVKIARGKAPAAAPAAAAGGTRRTAQISDGDSVVSAESGSGSASGSD